MAQHKEYKIIISNDGSDGVNNARADSPELILFDEATRHIPVIGITASDDIEVRLGAFREGAEEPRARVNSKFLRVDESKKLVNILKAADLELHIDRFEWIRI